MVCAGFATLLMNYEDMLTSGEACSSLFKLQVATRQHWGGGAEVVHATLVAWGKLIREKFDKDNSPLFMFQAPEAKPMLDLLMKMDSKMDVRCFVYMCVSLSVSVSVSVCVCVCVCVSEREVTA
jgi:hypothetical protein